LNAAAGLQAAAIKELDRLDEALLARAFSGNLAPQDPADEPAAVTLARLKSPTVARRSFPTEAYLIQLVPALLRAIGRPMMFDQLNAMVALLFLPEQFLPLLESVSGRAAREHFADFAQPNQPGALLNALILLGKAGTLMHSEVAGGVMLHLNTAKLPPIHFTIEADAQHLAAIAALVPPAVVKSSHATLEPERLRETLLTVS
jgi:hypothetical protein